MNRTMMKRRRKEGRMGNFFLISCVHGSSFFRESGRRQMESPHCPIVTGARKTQTLWNGRERRKNMEKRSGVRREEPWKKRGEEENRGRNGRWW